MRMLTRGKWQLPVLFLLALVHFTAGFAQAGPRVAVIAADGDDATKLAPLLEINLQQAGLTMVDRAHLNDALAEQKLQLLLSADAPGARAKLGQLLNANFLVFIRCPEKPTRRLEVITCETTQGVRLARATLPRADTIEKDVSVANDAVTKAIAKSAKAGLKLIAVAPWSSDDFTTQFDYRRDAFCRLVEAPLVNREDLVLVEFAEAEALKTELTIAGQPNLVRKQPLILSGTMKHSSVAPDAQVTVSLELTRGNSTLESWNSGQVAVKAAAAALPGAAVDLVNKADGNTAITAPAVQAKELADRAESLLKLSFYPDAAQMFEAALLLDPDNIDDHAGAGNALCSEMAQEMHDAEHGQPDTLENRQQAATVLAPACYPRMERILDHMRFVFERKDVSFQDWLDNGFVFPINFLYPRASIRQWCYDVAKYKKDHHVDDRSDEPCVGIIQFTTIGATDDDARYIADLTDVWPYRKSINMFFTYFANDTPQLRAILDHMDHSPNALAVEIAKTYRANLIKYGTVFAPNPPAPAPAAKPAVAELVPDFELVRMVIPLEDPHGQFYGWRPAGPHADIAMEMISSDDQSPQAGRFAAHYYRDDGFVKNLGYFEEGDGPAFDGKYVWWGENEKNVAVIHVYDPEHDKTWTAAAAQGVPPDALQHVYLAALSTGKVAIVGSADASDPTAIAARSWVAIAKMDPATGPSCKIILECREHVDMGHPGGIHSAFSPHRIAVLPGPPGAGAKATPHLYIGRREVTGTLLIDPDTAEASVINDDNGWKFAGIFLGGKLYRSDMTVWDPAADSVAQVSMPSGLAAPESRFEVGVNEWSGKIYYGTCVKHITYVWSTQDKTFKKPLIMRSPDPLNRDQPPEPVRLTQTSIFGLVDYIGQVHFISNHPDPLYHAVDWQTWMLKHLDMTHDSDGYLQMAQAAKEGTEEWYSDLDGYLKYSDPSSIDRGQWAVNAANDLMVKGDYARAAHYAAEAAPTGAQWAFVCQADAAEGQGDWKHSEQFIRQAASAPDGSRAWFMWCNRTGHGDLAAARAQYAATLNPNATDVDGLEKIVLFDMLTGDEAKAQPILKRLCDQNDPWACLVAADYAMSHGDLATRDSALAAGAKGDASDQTLAPLAGEAARDFPANQPITTKRIDFLGKLAVTNCPVGIDLGGAANLWYFAGRFLIFQGKNDLGIKYLKRSAGFSSYKTGRTLAAIYLRNHHIPIPKPAMDQ